MTRLGYFERSFGDDFFTEVALIFCNFMGCFEKHDFLRKD